MTTTQSLDVMRANHIRSMGQELGGAFFSLHRKLIELHVVWQQYLQLFGSDSETVALLNRTAGLFFNVVQDEIWDSVLLGISRMTDPSVTRGKKNLTIHSLPPMVNDPALKTDLQNLCLAALDQAAFAREHRNKRIAHLDHGYAIDKSVNSLSGISRRQVESILASLGEIMNRLNGHFRDSTMLYGNFVDQSGARVLVSKLRKLERLVSAADSD
ncbi:hypothetical protein RBI22_22005 [Alcaligenaceae bacterium C4P045]|nr:hypothetical protein [Alcaligenaceae bacterium C4P045]